MIETVKNEIAKAFKKQSVKYDVAVQNLRVKISLDNDKLFYVILNKTNRIELISLSKLIGFIYAPLAEGKLKEAMKNIITDNKLSTENANVRLYMLNNEAKAYLYDAGKPIKEIQIKNLLNN